MKSKFTTTLALVGVLAAGTGAAAVNTQALQSRAESTIGAGTTTLIAPETAASTATDVVELETPLSPEEIVANPDPAATSTLNTPTVSSTSTAGVTSTTSTKPKVTYSNPNPGTGEEDDEDEEEDEEDEEDEDDDEDDD